MYQINSCNQNMFIFFPLSQMVAMKTWKELRICLQKANKLQRYNLFKQRLVKGVIVGSKHWNISSSLQLVEKNENNQEANTSILYVQIHKDNNTEPDPELTADTGLQ